MKRSIVFILPQATFIFIPLWSFCSQSKLIVVKVLFAHQIKTINTEMGMSNRIDLLMQSLHLKDQILVTIIHWLRDCELCSGLKAWWSALSVSKGWRHSVKIAQLHGALAAVHHSCHIPAYPVVSTTHENGEKKGHYHSQGCECFVR